MFGSCISSKISCRATNIYSFSKLKELITDLYKKYKKAILGDKNDYQELLVIVKNIQNNDVSIYNDIKAKNKSFIKFEDLFENLPDNYTSFMNVYKEKLYPSSTKNIIKIFSMNDIFDNLLEVKTLSTKFSNDGFIKYNEHILNEISFFGMVTQNICYNCFDIAPTKTSNRMLNNIFGKMKYVNPDMYDDFISFIENVVNMKTRKLPLFSHIDYFCDKTNYAELAKNIW